MKLFKRILIIGLVAFIAIQFIRPEKNLRTAPSEGEIGRHFDVPPELRAVLRNSCYDCHSNNTRYPWYAEVQPVGWILASDISEAKSELNFDEFGNYSRMVQYWEFGKIQEQVENREMPLPSYLMMHPKAELSADTKARLINWTLAMRDSMKAHFPIDSSGQKRITQ